MASVPYAWSRRQLILLSTMRIALVPLLLLCCAPRSQPIIAGETPAFIFTAALGITNGLAGSLPMMFAPSKVPATLKEATGNMMTLSYNVGLTAGSLIGYVFDSMLGPPIVNPCPSYPYIPMPPSMVNTTTTTMRTLKNLSVTTVVSTTKQLITTTTLSPTTLPKVDNSDKTTIASIVVTTLATLLTSLNPSSNDTNTIFDASTITTTTLMPSTVISTTIFNNSTIPV